MLTPWRSLRFRWALRRCAPKLRALRLLVLDVDGVLTDGGLFYGADGEPFKRFDVRDGLGIRLLQDAGIEVAFLSGGRGGATQLRAAHLQVRHCLVGVKDKALAIAELSRQLGVPAVAVAYVGDDFNDLVVRGQVGLLLAPADATPALRQSADLVLLCKGGDRAIRSLAETILRCRGAIEHLKQQGWRDGNA
jgi:3-deoxy-D-manno-octulosonate 8-phosphate phosphatase (KDO 8-P phosphatase)